MTWRGVFSITALTLLLPGCAERRFERLSMNPNTDFSERIRRIAEQAGDLNTTTDVLFHDPAFIALYEQPGEFAGAAAALYADPSQPVLHKEIAGYAMQRLPLEAYGGLVAFVADLVPREQLPGRLLDKLAFPAFNWGAQLAVHYDEPRVRTLLEQMAVLPQLSQGRRTMIRERVLTGLTRKDFLLMQESGQVR